MLHRLACVAAAVVMVLSSLHVAASSPQSFSSPRGSDVADIVQWTPAALPWGVKLAGGSTRSDWGRMAVSQGIGAVVRAGAVEGLKHWTDAPRPDGSDRHAFPSGHAAVAFMGAAMVERELGWRSPWYTFGAYSVASAVAMERVIDRRHRPVDVIAGAGIGILATHIGYAVGDAIFGRSSILGRNVEVPGEPENIPFLALETSMIVPTVTVAVGDVVIKPEVALAVGVKLGVPVDDRWGCSARLALRSTPIYVRSGALCTYVAPLTAIGIELAGSYMYPVNNRVELNGELSAGYFTNFSLRSDDRSVKSGAGASLVRLSAGARYNFTDKISVGFNCGYELSGMRFSLEPSSAYNIPAQAEGSALTPSIVLNINTRVKF